MIFPLKTVLESFSSYFEADCERVEDGFEEKRRRIVGNQENC